MKFIQILMFLAVFGFAHADEVKSPTGRWKFYTKHFEDRVEIVLDFDHSISRMKFISGKSNKIVLKISGSNFTADFGFGEAVYFLKRENNEISMCSKMDINDCIKLEQEK